MLALTYPDGARVQRCDYLPENRQISPLIIERIPTINEIILNKNLYRNDYTSRYRRRSRGGGGGGLSLNCGKSKRRDRKNGRENYHKISHEEFSGSSNLCEIRYNKSIVENEKKDDRKGGGCFTFRESSQSERIRERNKDENYNENDYENDNYDDAEKFIFHENLQQEAKEEEKLPKTRRRRELPGRESWPGGRHPKDRCFLHLILIIVLIIIGYNKHSGGHFGSNINRGTTTGLGVFAFAIGRVHSAPISTDIITDTGVRSERSANLSHITGTSRKIQMYIKHRHLQILPDGTVNGSNDDTSDYTILQRTSVSRGQLRIQGVATCLYLCMDSCGLLYGSREYTEDCVFNETLEQHNYNTYSSAHWSTPRKTLYLGLSGRGQPRRVQAKGHNLGRLSAYARVLTQVVAQDRVDVLHRRMTGARHNVRHHHGSQQTVCPTLIPQEKDGRDKFRCRKRKKRKKRRRKCRTGEIPGPQCDVREIYGNANTSETQSKRSCEGAAFDEACRKEALDTPAKKRKSRIEDDDINVKETSEIDDVQDEDIVVVVESKSRRSNDRHKSFKNKKAKKSSSMNLNGSNKKLTGNKKNKKNIIANKNDKNLLKSMKKKSTNQSLGRSVRTTYRFSSSPAATTPATTSWFTQTTKINIKEDHQESPDLETSYSSHPGVFTERSKSLSSSSSSAVAAVSLAATYSLASTLTLTAAVASGEVFSDDSSITAQTRTDNVEFNLDEFNVEPKDFEDEDDDEREHDVDEEDERDDTKTDVNNFGIPNNNSGSEQRLAM